MMTWLIKKDVFSEVEVQFYIAQLVLAVHSIHKMQVRAQGKSHGGGRAAAERQRFDEVGCGHVAMAQSPTAEDSLDGFGEHRMCQDNLSIAVMDSV